MFLLSLHWPRVVLGLYQSYLKVVVKLSLGCQEFLRLSFSLSVMVHKFFSVPKVKLTTFYVEKFA